MIFCVKLSVLLCCCFCFAVVYSECDLPPNCPSKTQAYLTAYGYLDPNKTCEREDIEAGLRKFQEINIGLKNITVTGECDDSTVMVMNMPRCGCEDIVKMEKKMMPQNLYGPLEYIVGNTKWTEHKLTWKVTKYPRKNRISNADVDDAMRRALQIWADETKLTFQQRNPSERTDIDIRFETRRHTTQPPYFDFDGPGNVLAHAFFPKSGVVHFDDDETFVLGHDRGTELYIVAAHEFGHTLGISHTNIKDALMAPYYRYESPLKLHSDDIAAVQSIYGKKEKPEPTVRPRPTAAPTTRRPIRPTTPPRDRSPACDLNIKATFKMKGVTYVFTQKEWYSTTYVYKVGYSGISLNSKAPIRDLFRKRSSGRYPRAYPSGVDAAAYIPHKEYIFLFRGTRAYRYKQGRDNLFYLEENEGFPRWMNVKEFPERPRSAVAFPYSNHNSYYMLIFGATMVWDWNFYSERVGAWAYPIEVFGRNMPQNVNGAFLESKNFAVFLQKDRFYRFYLPYRRVIDSTYVKDVDKEFFKITC